MNKPYIRIVSPRPNGFKMPKYAKDSLQSVLDCDEWDSEVVEPEGSELHILRNTGVGASEVKGEFTHVHNSNTSRTLDYTPNNYVLQVDADIEYTPEHVRALLARNVDIVSAAYQFRLQPNCITAGLYAPNRPELRGFLPYKYTFNNQSTGFNQCDWVGAGFLLVKKHVFEAIDWPWFWNGVRCYTENNAQKAFFISEDVGFCLNAQGHGFDIHVDADVVVKHHIGNETD